MNGRIDDHSDEAKSGMRDAIASILEEVGLEAEKFAKLELENAPRRIDTGNLRNSVTHDVNVNEGAVYIGTNVEYAIYVHEGTGIYATNGGRKDPWVYKDSKGNWHLTKGMKPNRFLRNAVERNADHLKTMIETFLKS